MKEYINSICTGELYLETNEMTVALHCDQCLEKLTLKSQALLEMARRKPPTNEEESKLLACKKCKRTCTITHQLERTMEEGFRRCFNRERLSQKEVIDLKWIGLQKRPETNTPEFQKWLLQVASVQIDVNLHDWRHRASCFKKQEGNCRYKLPREPVEETIVKPIYSATDSKETLLCLKILNLLLIITKNNFLFKFNF